MKWDDFLSIWEFKDKIPKEWRTPRYPAKFNPFMVRRILKYYSKEGDSVLDPFVGSGMTILQCYYLNRVGVGFDCNPLIIEEALNNLMEKTRMKNIHIQLGNACDLSRELADESFDLILTSPPYWITQSAERKESKGYGERKSDKSEKISYSKYLYGKNHLGKERNLDGFLEGIRKAISEMYRVLRDQRYCVIVIGDTWRVPERNREGTIWHNCPLHYYIIKIATEIGFKFHDLFIQKLKRPKMTWFKKYPFPRSIIEHDYILIFWKGDDLLIER